MPSEASLGMAALKGHGGRLLSLGHADPAPPARRPRNDLSVAAAGRIWMPGPPAHGRLQQPEPQGLITTATTTSSVFWGGGGEC